MSRALRSLFVTLLVLFAPGTALADVALRTTVSSAQVEVGDAVRVELSATSSTDAEPSDPRLPPVKGFDVAGPSVGVQQRMSFVNGAVRHERGITATWTLVAKQPGKYVIGPPTVAIGGVRQPSNSVTVEVVPAGSLPQKKPRRRRRGLFFDDDFDPFGLLHGMRPDPRDPSLDPFLSGRASVPEEYVPEKAEDRIAFLRAVVSPESAVVGQQVTLKIFAYDARGPFEETTTSEPSRADFLSHVIVNTAHNQPMYRVNVGERTYHAVKAREIALFPLHAGRLTIGPMKMGFRRPGSILSQPDSVVVRRSSPLEVLVTDPPEAGRPPGFQSGNVGRFSLTATVEPRSIRAGEAVSVFVTLEGTGNLPSEPVLPVRRGVDWAKPRVTEEVTTNGSIVKGTKKLAYVVRLEDPGSIDLGELQLAFFDPNTGRYDTARAALGTVEVAEAPGDARPDDDVRDGAHGNLARLTLPRKALGAPPNRPLLLSDRPWFWSLLLGPPLAVLAAGTLGAVGRRFRTHRATRRGSVESAVRELLAEAREAARAGDAKGAAGLVEKALYAAIEHETGVRARGVLRSELAALLEDRGVPPEAAAESVRLLDACEAARFTSAGDPPVDLCDRAAALRQALRRAPRKERVRA